jgi:hypothetical protein
MSNITTAHEYEGHPQFENHYLCSECGATWIDIWYAMCDDKCPDCGAEITPSRSIEITEEVDRLPDQKHINLLTTEENNMNNGKVEICGKMVVTDEETAELIRQAKIYIHTKQIAARMLKQQQEEFKSWGYPWDGSVKTKLGTIT